jgi:exopolysaccharide biosynthesis polyprenyl glycosylphosphotransferase
MKKSELFFSALQVPVDYLMIVLAGLTAYFLRTSELIQGIKLIEYQFSIRQFVEVLLVTAAFFVIVYAFEGLYDIRSTKRLSREVYRVFRATMLGLMIIIVGIFVDREIFSSRFIILAGGFFVVIFVSTGRMMLGVVQRHLLVTRKIGVHRVLLIGVGDICGSIKRQINENKYKGYQLVGHISDIDLERIARIKKLKGVDEIIQCDSKATKNNLLCLKEFAMHNRISFRYTPTLLQTVNYNLGVFLGEPMIEVKNTPLDGWGKIIKRAVDILGAVVGILIFGIPMIIIALAIWLESGGPIVFFNERVGHKGNFNLYKFRYMKNKYCHGKQFSKGHNKKALLFLRELIEKQSIKKGPIYKIKDDPRKTKVGAFLERFSLDEFPQFFNVLVGEMSLVGPRPHQPIEVEKYESYQRRLLTIKPGITGMAQISGRSDLEFDDEVRLDTFYIENWSLWLDLQIIAKTVPALLQRRKN